MSTYFYDVCIHDEDYEERSGVEFTNPVSKGDFVTSGTGDTEYEVFQVVHSSVGGGSAIHVREQASDGRMVDDFIHSLPEEI